MNLAQAWDTTKGNPNVVVQVLDTGLDLAHEDLQMNIWRNAGETDCTDGVDNDNNGFVDDCHGRVVLRRSGVACCRDERSGGGAFSRGRARQRVLRACGLGLRAD